MQIKGLFNNSLPAFLQPKEIYCGLDEPLRCLVLDPVYIFLFCLSWLCTVEVMRKSKGHADLLKQICVCSFLHIDCDLYAGARLFPSLTHSSTAHGPWCVRIAFQVERPPVVSMLNVSTFQHLMTDRACMGAGMPCRF